MHIKSKGKQHLLLIGCDLRRKSSKVVSTFLHVCGSKEAIDCARFYNGAQRKFARGERSIKVCSFSPRFTAFVEYITF